MRISTQSIACSQRQMYTCIHHDRQTDRQRHRQTDRDTERDTHTHRRRQRERQRERQRQTERQADKQRHREKEGDKTETGGKGEILSTESRGGQTADKQTGGGGGGGGCGETKTGDTTPLLSCAR